MTDPEREKLGNERKLIFENVANGVPDEQVRCTFRRSGDEIAREVAFVAKKIREYRFRRRMPPVACDTFLDIRVNRLVILDTLRHLGPLYLSSDLLLPKIAVHKIDTPDNLQEAAGRTGLTVHA